MDWNDVLADYEGKFSDITVLRLTWQQNLENAHFTYGKLRFQKIPLTSGLYSKLCYFLCYFLRKDGLRCSNYLCVFVIKCSSPSLY